MATRIFEEETLELYDGREVTVRPLPIKTFRVFMDRYNDLVDVKEEEEAIEVMFDCALIALKRFNEGIEKEYLEENLDLETMTRIVEVAGSMRLAPNQNPAIQATE